MIKITWFVYLFFAVAAFAFWLFAFNSLFQE